MLDEQPQQPEQSTKVSDRIDLLEKALAFDTRLQALERAISDRFPKSKPWWRDAKIVTFLATLIAALIPILKFMGETFRSSREYKRQVIEQQDRIRQTYLDKVLKSGVTLAEQQKIFGLLKKLSADNEMQSWAQQEFQTNEALLKDLTAQRERVLSEKAQLCVQVLSYAKPATKDGEDYAAIVQVRAKVYELDLKIFELSRELTIPSPKPACY